MNTGILRSSWGRAPFYPTDMTRSGRKGIIFDPSDLSTLFQDAAGTIPVAADGDPVGLMLDRASGEKVVNLFSYSDNITEGTTTGWSNHTVFSSISPVNPYLPEATQSWLHLNDGGGSRARYYNFSGLQSGVYTLTMWIEQYDSDEVSIGIYSIDELFLGRINYNFSTEIITVTGVSPISSSAEIVQIIGPNGGKLIRLTISAEASIQSTLRAYYYPSGLTANTMGSILHGYQLSYGSTPQPYQRKTETLPGHAWQNTTAAKPLYKTDGVHHWLEHDTVDDFLQFEPIQYTGLVSAGIAYRVTDRVTYSAWTSMIGATGNAIGLAHPSVSGGAASPASWITAFSSARLNGVPTPLNGSDGRTTLFNAAQTDLVGTVQELDISSGTSGWDTTPRQLLGYATQAKPGGRLYAYVEVEMESLLSYRDKLEEWLAEKSGVILP